MCALQHSSGYLAVACSRCVTHVWSEPQPQVFLISFEQCTTACAEASAKANVVQVEGGVYWACMAVLCGPALTHVLNQTVGLMLLCYSFSMLQLTSVFGL